MTPAYDRKTVEHLLPYIWSEAAAYGVQSETMPEPGMPRGSSKNVAHGNTIFAMLADVREAWRRAELTVIERQGALLKYGFDYTYEAIGAYRGVRKSAAQEGVERAVGKLVAWLNGSDYIDGYDDLAEPGV